MGYAGVLSIIGLIMFLAGVNNWYGFGWFGISTSKLEGLFWLSLGLYFFLRSDIVYMKSKNGLK